MNIKQLAGVLTGTSGKLNFPENIELVRRLGADSMVLLKNDDLLPIKRGHVALFGAGAVDTIFCANLSSYVFCKEKINVMDGLSDIGFTFSSTTWLKKMKKATAVALRDTTNNDAPSRLFGGKVNHPEEVMISDADLAEARLGTDTCIYVIRRDTTENKDREYIKGDYLLSEAEESNIAKLSSGFNKIIVVLNSPMIDLNKIHKNKSVKSIIYMGIPGMEAGHSLGDILIGATTPSGHLTDTWANKYKDYPTCGPFIKPDSNISRVDYNEGIFVGYRYFDTFDVAPMYPFGFGLSYTTFSFIPTYFEANWFNCILKVKVTNTGNSAGRSVVQLYVTAPNGKIQKPFQQLKAFAKTGKIKPGGCEEIIIKIPTKDLASFSEKKSAYVMERGTYLLRIGEDSRDTSIAARIELDKMVVVENCFNVVAQQEQTEFMEPPARITEKVDCPFTEKLLADNFNSEATTKKVRREMTAYVPEGSTYKSLVNENTYDIPNKSKEVIEYVKPCSYTSLLDVAAGRASVESFVSSLPTEVLARIVVGPMDESKSKIESRLPSNLKIKRSVKVAGHTTDQYTASLGIPGTTMVDGPFGLHIPGMACTCYPSATSMAQTWDISALKEMGRAYGREMEFYKIDFCLAPSVNIHRNPLAGRSTEFYSEDPLLSGEIAAAFTDGVQQYPGRRVVLKHMAAYNQESNRHHVDINLSQQALREIYLKSFEICVKNSEISAIMSSSTKINGEFSSSRRDLNIDILRNEWGFDGFVMSEWGTHSDKACDLHGGCDLIMPGFNPDIILEAMHDTRPHFEPDGYVLDVATCKYYDMPMVFYDNWGTFVPDKDGDDIAMTVVDADVEVNPMIPKLIKEGVCTIKKEENGSKTIRYKGYSKGAYLGLADLQQATIHILKGLLKTGSMMELIEQSKKQI